MKITQFSRNKILPLLSCLALLGTSLSASAATDYFLKFDGIDAEGTSKGHEKWSDINSFSWGVSATSSFLGGGAGAGKPVLSDFSWTQGLDSSFTPLFANITSGKHIKNAVVDFTTVGKTSQVYFKMTFDDVLLTNVALSAIGGTDSTFAGSFAYGKVTLDYWAQKADGSLGAKTSASYDLKTGTGNVGAVAAVFAQGLIGPQVAVVPEPESYAMLLAGLGLIGLIARRRLGV